MVIHEEVWNKPTIRYWWCREGLFLFRPRRLLVLLPVKRFLVFDTILPTDFLLLPLAEVTRLSSSEEELGSILGPIVSDATKGDDACIWLDIWRTPCTECWICETSSSWVWDLIPELRFVSTNRGWVYVPVTTSLSKRISSLFYFPVVMLPTFWSWRWRSWCAGGSEKVHSMSADYLYSISVINCDCIQQDWRSRRLQIPKSTAKISENDHKHWLTFVRLLVQ